MEKLKFDRIKKTMAILLIAFFVMSVTAASVSAHGAKGKANGQNYGKYVSMSPEKYKDSSAANIYAPTSIQSIVAVNVQPTIVTTTVINVLSPGDTTVDVDVDSGITNDFDQIIAHK